MANASSKRIAAANSAALRGLVRNMLVINVLTLAVRAMKSHFYIRPFIPSWFPLLLNLGGFIATVFIWRWFVAIGAPRRDASGNIKSGDDLMAKGVIEFAWDVVYMTWICTLGSALLGNWFWWLYLAIPGIGGFKLYGVAKPFLGMLLPSIFGPRQPKTEGAAQEQAAAGQPSESKKQAKLRARAEKGDKRVQQQTRR